MPRKGSAPEYLFGTTWVHVFEEDTEKGAVYRPDDADIPLSRRPRGRFTLEPGGGAHLFVAGADDRFVELDGTWKEEGGTIVVRDARKRRVMRIVEHGPERLVIASL